MSKHRVLPWLGALAAAAVLSGPPAARAAAVVITDCSAGGGNVIVASSITKLNVAPTDDVTLRCQLQQLPGTDGILVEVHSLVVDGPNGGGIQSTNKSGIRIQAGMNQMATACAVAGDHTATVNIISATLEDQNANGNLNIQACGDIIVDTGGGSQLKSAGATVSLTCYEPSVNPQTGQPCQIKIDHATLFGNNIIITAEGDVTIVCTQFQTIGPRDLHKIISKQGSVLAGGKGVPPPDPSCVCGVECGNKFRGGIESNMEVTADDNVDLDHACIEIAENIFITAKGTNGPLLPGGVMLDLSFAEIRDDFGKTGNIVILAHPIAPVSVGDGGQKTGDGVVDIDMALLIDTGKKGGGPDPQTVSSINGGTQTVVGPCNALDPASTCVGRGINLVENPVRASAASRTLRSVINAASVRCDT